MKEDLMTIDKVMEAKALIEALAPKQAPDSLNMILGSTGLKIMKNKMMPDDMIMVSKNLFDIIFEASEEKEKGAKKEEEV